MCWTGGLCVKVSFSEYRSFLQISKIVFAVYVFSRYLFLQVQVVLFTKYGYVKITDMITYQVSDIIEPGHWTNFLNLDKEPTFKLHFHKFYFSIKHYTCMNSSQTQRVCKNRLQLEWLKLIVRSNFYKIQSKLVHIVVGLIT